MSSHHRQPQHHPDCPPGDDALLQSTGGGVIRRLRDMQEVATREADRMFLDAAKGNTYKVFTNQGQAHRVHGAFVEANRRRIATPRFVLMTGKLRSHNQCRNVWMLKVEYASGRFFRLAVPGKARELVSDVCGTGDVATIKRTIRLLLTAYNRGLTDPQGFFNPRKNVPIQFIDIHFTSGPVGALALYNVAAELNRHLHDMGSTPYIIEQDGRIRVPGGQPMPPSVH